MVRKVLVSSLKKPKCSEENMIKLRRKLPITLTANVPYGKVSPPFCTHVLITYRSIAPTKPPIPTINIEFILVPPWFLEVEVISQTRFRQMSRWTSSP